MTHAARRSSEITGLSRICHKNLRNLQPYCSGRLQPSSNPEFLNPSQMLPSLPEFAAAADCGAAKSGCPHGCGGGATGLGRLGTEKSGRSKSKTCARLFMSVEASLGVSGTRFQRHSMNLSTDE